MAEMRKIVQIAAAGDGGGSDRVWLFALADDGTVWSTTAAAIEHGNWPWRPALRLPQPEDS